MFEALIHALMYMSQNDNFVHVVQCRVLCNSY